MMGNERIWAEPYFDGKLIHPAFWKEIDLAWFFWNNRQTFAELNTKQNMIAIYVFLDNGNFFTTGFNGSFEQAEKYYLGQSFEQSDETMAKVVKIEIAPWLFGKNRQNVVELNTKWK